MTHLPQLPQLPTLPPLLLIGAGGHARACIDVIEEQGRYRIVGLVGTDEEQGSSVLGYPVLGTDRDLPALLAQYPAIVTVGQIKSARLRMHLFEEILRHGRTVPAIVSPLAHVSRHALVGDGSIVMHGAVINAAARVGVNCIINSQALVEHDCVIADHCHVSTGARLNSAVGVGSGSFIGSGATVRQGTRIGQHCIIGMGLDLLRDCADHTLLPQPRSDK